MTSWSEFGLLVVGMIAALVLFAFVYRTFRAEPEPEVVSAPEANPLQIVDHDQLLRSKDQDQVLDYLQTLDSLPRSGALDVDLGGQQRRIAIAQHLVDISKSEQYIAPAARSLIQAHSTILQLCALDARSDPQTVEDLNLVESLRRISTRYVDHPNADLALDARMALLTNDVINYIVAAKNRGSRESIRKDRLAICLSSLRSAMKSPDAPPRFLNHVAGMLGLLFETDREEAVALTNEIYDQQLQDGPVPDYIQDFHDLVLLHELNFDEAFENRREQAAVGEFPLADVARKLLEEPSLGKRGAVQVRATIAWLELEGETDQAMGLWQDMRRCAPLMDQPQLRSELVEMAEKGKQRLSSIGETTDWNTPTVDGRTLTNATLDGRTTLVIFWSGKEDEAFQRMGRRFATRNTLPGDPEVVVICRDTGFSPGARAWVDQATDWWFVAESDCGWAASFPVINLPHLLLLDGERKIARVRTEFTQLQADLKASIPPELEDGSGDQEN